MKRGFRKGSPSVVWESPAKTVSEAETGISRLKSHKSMLECGFYLNFTAQFKRAIELWLK
ncbi:hypothetical protein SAMN04488132_104267 [Sediminibacterium ginsengisoli]|uniref:Uncharacterized protein n=1 Tax=Sediminibacterium ginsengisoli TaxID=413434 RepID=A0A1T4NI71_9BACT|nr:hypothetical protein SAMN04488132_104267 [Sediminibacterium ginsengisoli]